MIAAIPSFDRLLSEYGPRYALAAVGILLFAFVGRFFARGKRGMRPGPQTLHGVCIAMVALFTLVFGAMQVLRIATFHTYADTATEIQAIESIASTGVPHSSVQEGLAEGPNVFGHHASLLYYPLAGIYRFLPAPAWVLVLGVLCVALGAVPVYLEGLARWGPGWACLVPPAAYLLYPTVGYAAGWEFHALLLGVPLAAFAFTAMRAGRGTAYLVLGFLALAAREEMAAVVASIALYGIVTGRERSRSVLLLVASVAWLGLYTQVIAPALAPDAAAFRVRYWEGFGDSPWNVLSPVRWAQALAAAGGLKLANLLLFGLPVLFLPFLGGFRLLLFVPYFLLMFVSSTPSVHSIFLYYAAPVLPLFFIAGIRGLDRADRWLTRWPEPPGRVQRDGWGAWAGAALGAAVLLGGSPFGIQFWRSDWRLAPFAEAYFHHSVYRVRPIHRTREAFLAGIPSGTRTAAPNSLLLALRHCDVVQLPSDRAGMDRLFPGVELAILEMDHPNRYGFRSRSLAEQRRLLIEYGFEEADRLGGIVLFRRPRGEATDAPPGGDPGTE